MHFKIELLMGNVLCRSFQIEQLNPIQKGSRVQNTSSMIFFFFLGRYMRVTVFMSGKNGRLQRNLAMELNLISKCLQYTIK